jgi:hypothetical protein
VRDLENPTRKDVVTSSECCECKTAHTGARKHSFCHNKCAKQRGRHHNAQRTAGGQMLAHQGQQPTIQHDTDAGRIGGSIDVPLEERGDIYIDAADVTASEAWRDPVNAQRWVVLQLAGAGNRDGGDWVGALSNAVKDEAWN